ncbi:endonuclease/exonuclease/phosphatase family protein [Paenibacillus thalictri]|nr:endonuclease/exonuclease/phosphatase family protein [Paenibacillus thalictri]
MKAKIKALVSLLIVLSISHALVQTAVAESESGEQAAQTVRFMSYNIRHGQGDDDKFDLNRTADVIKKSNAEIVGLQEVDNNWSARSEFLDEAKKLSELLGMEYAFIANLEQTAGNGQSEPRQYGTAVLSKYPIKDSRRHPLPKIEDSSEPRGLLEATIDVGGTDITVFNTHMSIIAGERVVQIKELAGIAGKKSGPVVFMGDFNAKPNTFEMRPLMRNYNEAFRGKNALTAPTSKPASQIDFILFNNDFELLSSEVLQTIASDHLPVTAQLRIKGKVTD